MQTQVTGLAPTPSEYSLSTCPVNDLSAINATLASDALLPEQFYRTPSLTEHHSGVAGLMLAVCEDALKCFQRQFSCHNRRDQRLAREAEACFFATNEAHLFAFENICQVLGFDPCAIRGQLKRWQQESKHEKASFRLAA